MAIYESVMDARTVTILRSLLSFDAIKQEMKKLWRSRVSLADARQWIEEGFARDKFWSWNTALTDRINRALSADQAEMEKTMRQELIKAVKVLAKKK